MTALIVILAVFVLLFIISLLRFGAEFEYSGEGMYAACICGPLKIKLIPPSDKPKKEKKQKNKKEKKGFGKETL